MLTWIDDESQPLPTSDQALNDDEGMPGLAAVGGELTPTRLEEAYRKGLFPWFSEDQPVLWWSPDPRMALPVADFKLSQSLRKTLRRFAREPGCEVRVDSAFDAVIQACAQAPRTGQSGTWIVSAMVEAYSLWHRLGRVHSVETWVDGRLVGGLYGVAIGRMFFGESMFAHASDASKVALAALVCLCREHGVPLIDCQQNTRHLASLGAREMSRQDFDTHLRKVLAQPDIENWTYHSSLWRHLIDPFEPPERTAAPPFRKPS
jgi:leucyl/phenylalanyl-tRNA--protein transferase